MGICEDIVLDTVWFKLCLVCQVQLNIKGIKLALNTLCVGNVNASSAFQLTDNGF